MDVIFFLIGLTIIKQKYLFFVLTCVFKVEVALSAKFFL